MFGQVSPNRGKLAGGNNQKGVRIAVNKGKATPRCAISQIDMNGSVVKVWATKASVARYLNVTERTVTKYVTGQHLIDGYYWLLS